MSPNKITKGENLSIEDIIKKNSADPHCERNTHKYKLSQQTNDLNDNI